MIIWITGARGFIGRYLARDLASHGNLVAGIGHGAWPAIEARHWGIASWINGEISASNLDQMQQAGGSPDVVFHLAGGSSVGAAIANPLEDFTRTVVTTATLLEWLRQHAPQAKVVAVSSAAVYGAGHEGAITERAATMPYSPYGAHKFMMEELCRSYAANFGLSVVLPRLFSVYGPGLKKQLLWDLCCKLAAGGAVELGGTGKELRDWVDVRDVARVLGRLPELAGADAPVINVASGAVTPVSEIAGHVLTAWERARGESRTVSFNGRSRPGDPFSLVADNARMRTLAIGDILPVAQGIAEYVGWYLTSSGDEF
ncbi:SDR family oxidoreductase [Ferriphaselus sp. R-1]|uniref:NAD-dependent epimerase/dehydratase family protein n=1 Tax=Ferriphaselus sp. R-1 TaxID=1485544 RepID=UPI0005538AD2|nr:SDR family oxidoreductase [Ferriphaselus sp. R-1]